MSASNVLHTTSFMTGCKGKKVKCALAPALRLCTGRSAHRGSRGIALLFLDHGTRRGEWWASRPCCSLPPGKRRYPMYRRLGGPQGRSGQVQKISSPTGIRSPDRPARSQSLYRLNYRPTWQYVDLPKVNGWLKDAVSSATRDAILSGWLKAIRSHRVPDIMIKTNLQSFKYNVYSS